MIFISGIFFGSFFTLAVYRIPIGENITHKHSYCPNCNHKLHVLDLIPVLSYIFLRGKCRYCGNPIRIRYFLLEILSGMTFVLLGISMKFSIFTLDKLSVINYSVTVLYFTALFIIAGIDKEKRYIHKSVLLYGLVVVCSYIIYLCTLGNTNIYRYVIYLLMMIIWIFVDTFCLINKAESKYFVDILMLCNFFLLESNCETLIATVIISIFLIYVVKAYKNIRRKLKKALVVDESEQKIPLGFYLSVSNIIVIILTNFVVNYFSNMIK